LGLGDPVAGIVVGFDVSAVEQIKTLLLLLRRLREGGQQNRTVAGDHVTELPQVVHLGAVVRKDQQNRTIEALRGLVCNPPFICTAALCSGVVSFIVSGVLYSRVGQRALVKRSSGRPAFGESPMNAL